MQMTIHFYGVRQAEEAFKHNLIKRFSALSERSIGTISGIISSSRPAYLGLDLGHILTARKISLHSIIKLESARLK